MFYYSIIEFTPKSHFCYKDIFPHPNLPPKGEGVTLSKISNFLFFVGFLYFSPLGENERGNKSQKIIYEINDIDCLLFMFQCVVFFIFWLFGVDSLFKCSNGKVNSNEKYLFKFLSQLGSVPP